MTHRPNRSLKAIITLITPPIVMAMALLTIPFISTSTLDDENPLRLPPPDSLPSWEAVPLLYCQNRDCLSEISPADNSILLCPKCGDTLDPIPLPEKEVLPKDTLHFRKRYRNENGQAISLIAVVSGQSRSSLHKPELCLPAQGLHITREMKHTVQLSDGRPLEMTLLDVATDRSPKVAEQGLFVYWYSSKSVQTGSQFKKNLTMLGERLFKGKVDRWAYVSLLIPYTGTRDDAVVLADAFLTELYPHIEQSQQSD